VGSSAETLKCSAECTVDTDCPGSCCIDVTDANYRVCGGPEFCP
jgi:hypothetical protein